MAKNNLINFRHNYRLLSLLFGSMLLLNSCLKEDLFPASGQPNPYISLVDVRKVYKGTAVVLDAENLEGSSKITGVVVTDVASGNIPTGTFAIQQTRRGLKRGIEVFVTGAPNLTYKFGDSVSVDVIGATITRKKGVLQIEVASSAKIAKNAENITVEPIVVNIATFNSKFSEYESTLLKISNVDAVANGNLLAGDVTVSEPGSTGIVHTEAGAIFAAKKVALNASYTGIARYNNANGNGVDGALKQLWPLSVNSIEDESGNIYDNFPEDFENGTDPLLVTGYDTKTGNFKTGNYTLTNTYLGGEGNDLAHSGIYALRLLSNATSPSWCTMNYDLPNGATKVTLWAGSYGASADLGSTWRIEYSQNQGITWSQLGDDILTISKTKKQFTFLTDIRGAVRFRIGKIGIGTSTSNNQNGRFSIDDLAIYKNPESGGPVTNPVPTYQTLLAWQFGTPATTGAEASNNSTTTNTNLTTGILERGSGLVAAGLVRSMGSTAAGPLIPSTKAIAVAQNTYFQTKFTVKAGGPKISLSAINIKLRRSGAGGKNIKWFYSLDGVTFRETTGTGDVNYEGSDTEGQEMPTYYVYQTPELQNIAAGTTVYLRMYTWGFTNITTGSFAIGRTPASTTTNVLSIGGQIVP